MANVRKNAGHLDDVDRRIIAHLKRNGRASTQKIGQEVGLSAAAVGARIRRLEKTQILRLVAMADFDVLGWSLLLVVGIKVERREARAVARELAELPQVFSCSVMAGKYNIEGLVALPDAGALKEFLEVDLAAIEGIGEVSVEIAVDVLKSAFDVVPFAP